MTFFSHFLYERYDSEDINRVMNDGIRQKDFSDMFSNSYILQNPKDFFMFIYRINHDQNKFPKPGSELEPLGLNRQNNLGLDAKFVGLSQTKPYRTETNTNPMI